MTTQGSNESAGWQAQRVRLERYEALARTATQFVWGTGPTGIVEDMPEWRHFTGQTLEEVAGFGWANAVHPDDRDRAMAAWRQAVTERSLYQIEYRARYREGGYRWLSVRGLPVLETDGSIREWVGVADDVTARKEAEARLIESNETLSRQSEELRAQREALAALYEQLRERHDQVVSEREARLVEANETLAAQAEELQTQTETLIHQQGALEAAHREAESRREILERILQSTPAGISYMNRDLVYEWVNPVQARLWGIPAERVVGRSVEAVFGIGPDSDVVRLLRGVVETGQEHHETNFPFSYLVDGEPRVTLWDFSYVPVKGLDGEIEGVLVTANEVTERKRQEEAVRQSEARYRGLFESSRDAIVIATTDRGIIDVNPAFTRQFGYTLADVAGESSEPLYVDRETYAAVGRAVIGDPQRREAVVIEAEMKRRDGSTYPAEITSYLVRDASDRPVRLVATLRDLSAQREAERQRERHHRELAAQKAFAENLIQNIPTGIAYLDRDLVFRVVNPVYADFVQVPPERIVNRFLFDVLPADRAQIEPILRQVIDTGKPFYAKEFPFVYTTPEGVERTTYWDFVYYPVRADENEPVEGVFALADEISHRIEQQRTERELREEQERLQRERLEALEQTDRLKDQFLGILSHELRTPINAIMGFGSVLDDGVLGPLTPDQRSYTGKILSSADALLALIEDLLVVSRVQAGKFSVNPQGVEAAGVIEEALDGLAPLADRKGITLAPALDPTLGTVWVDALRLAQVVTNLVGNAIKFSPEGARVKVSARRLNDAWRLEVTDEGIGIAESDLPKLFQRFTQLDMSNTRAASGAGLGLSIVKAIVDAHGGSIGVESTVGEGSTFWVSLPLAPPA